MVAFASSAQPGINARQDLSLAGKLRETSDAVRDTFDALGGARNSADVAGIAKTFVDKVSGIHGLGDPDMFRAMSQGSRAISSMAGSLSALGQFAKVFEAGLKIAYGGEPSQESAKFFANAINTAVGADCMSGASFAFGRGFRPF